MAITVSGTTITFNDATTQTTAFTGAGGVTSLNGQTGAITNTTLGNIGSVIVAGYNSTTGGNVGAGNTFSGSLLYYVSTIVSGGYNNGWLSNTGVNIYTQINTPFSAIRRARDTGGYVAPLGCTALTGTWRSMTFTPNGEIISSCLIESVSNQCLFVRVS